jgi:hypothetical protein
LTSKQTAQAHAGGLQAARAAGLPLNHNNAATKARAAQWQEQIESLIGGGTPAHGAGNGASDAAGKMVRGRADMRRNAGVRGAPSLS